jgi:hypothetical protein
MDMTRVRIKFVHVRNWNDDPGRFIRRSGGEADFTRETHCLRIFTTDIPEGLSAYTPKSTIKDVAKVITSFQWPETRAMIFMAGWERTLRLVLEKSNE